MICNPISSVFLGDLGGLAVNLSERIGAARPHRPTGERRKTSRIKRQEKRGKKQRGKVGLGQDDPATEGAGKVPALLEDTGGTPAVPWKRWLLPIFR